MATNGDGVDWEEIARDQLERRAERLATDIEEAIRLLGGEIARGTADHGDVVEARQVIEEAIYVLEDQLAPAVPDDTGRGDTRYVHSDGTAADYLGLTMDQVNEARAGGSVEIDDVAIRALMNGESVRVETQAGIGIHLKRATNGEVNAGP